MRTTRPQRQARRGIAATERGPVPDIEAAFEFRQQFGDFLLTLAGRFVVHDERCSQVRERCGHEAEDEFLDQQAARRDAVAVVRLLAVVAVLRDGALHGLGGQVVDGLQIHHDA